MPIRTSQRGILRTFSDQGPKSAVRKAQKEQENIVYVGNGAPENLRDSARRYVHIFQPARNVMQSGRALSSSGKPWKLEFDRAQPRWDNPLIGWTSSRDPVQAISLSFETKEEAVAFAKKNGWAARIAEPKAETWKNKSYGENFAYSRGPLKLIRTK